MQTIPFLLRSLDLTFHLLQSRRPSFRKMVIRRLSIRPFSRDDSTAFGDFFPPTLDFVLENGIVDLNRLGPSL
jgi:hypothetical protein